METPINKTITWRIPTECPVMEEVSATSMLSPAVSCLLKRIFSETESSVKGMICRCPTYPCFGDGSNVSFSICSQTVKFSLVVSTFGLLTFASTKTPPSRYS